MTVDGHGPYRLLPFDIEHQRGRIVRRRAWLVTCPLALLVWWLAYAVL